MEKSAEQELIKQAQREYKRKWRENNPEKVKQHNRTFWLKKAVALKEGGANSGN